MTDNADGDKQFVSILDALCLEHTRTAGTTMVKAIGGWIDLFQPSTLTYAEMRGLIDKFEHIAFDTVRNKAYARRNTPPVTPAPSMSWPRALELTDQLLEQMRRMSPDRAIQYLGTLAGSYILSCPRWLVEQTMLEEHGPTTADWTDDEISFELRKWLHYSFD